MHGNEYFDFEIKNITPFGRSVDVVIPLSAAISENAIYRKYSESSHWQNFVEDANNMVASSLTVNGVCPPPHSEMYVQGLTQGDYCLRLTIQDGGANDADGIANGSIDDPGGLAVLPNETLVKQETAEKSSSGSVNLFLLFMLACIVYIRNKRYF